MGQKLTKLKPVRRFCAETGGAMTLFIASHASASRYPPPTPSPAPSSGAGAVQNPSRVRWGLATNLVYAWLLTIPASGLVAAAAWWVGSHFIR
jgi:PiT family inorganic phosphate transporter